MIRRVGAFAGILAILLGGTSGATPVHAQQTHPAVADVAVDEHPGAPLPLDTVFVDEEGRTVPLGRFFTGDNAMPVLVVPGYYRCEMLCGVLAPRLYQALQEVDDWEVGETYRVVLVSIDPREGPEDARARRRDILPDAGPGWSLLTGSESAIAALADAIGFRYHYDPQSDQFAHAALVVAASPDGKVARYVYGVDPRADTLSAVLAAAHKGRSATSLEQILVRCFRFTPSLRKHAALLADVLRGGAVLILAGLAGIFVLAGRRAARDRGAR